MSQKKTKIGRPKLPKGEAKARIVPVRFSGNDLKAMAKAARASKQTVSEWIRRTIAMELNGSTYQPLTAATGGNYTAPTCPKCLALASATLTNPMCDDCKRNLMAEHRG